MYARMITRRRAQNLTAGFLVATALFACSAPTYPDMIIHSGTIHTGVDDTPTAEAVSIRNGRIVAVGSTEEIVETYGGGTQFVDLKGTHLYPGFVDSHVHLSAIGERELTLNLDSVTSIDHLTTMLAHAVQGKPEGEMLEGRGWIETHWPEARFPTRHDIDEVTGDRPTLLIRADGHALLANTAAIKAAGLLDGAITQPDGGRIELDEAGNPTGMLIDSAMSLVTGSLAKRPQSWIDDTYKVGANKYAQLGWTSVHNMSVPAAHIERLNKLSEAGELPLRIFNAVEGTDETAFEVMGRSESGLVTTKAIKFYMDGALGSRGALLSEPYTDRPNETGLQLMQAEETMPLLQQALSEDVQVAFHAIGDLGNSRVLNWMQNTFETANVDGSEKRWRIEHAQIIHPDEIARFAELGVIASMQPSHAIGDLHFAPDRLGNDRLEGAYAWRSLIDADVLIAAGSDAPVEQGDPRIEFYAAVARKDLKGFADENWNADQRVTRQEALKMFTQWPAYAAFRENDLGTIEVGKIADFTGFDGDLMTMPEAEILTLDPTLTIIAGAIVFDGITPNLELNQ